MKNDLPIRQTARAAISVCSKSVGAGKIYQCVSNLWLATLDKMPQGRVQRMDLSARANTEKANGVEYFRFEPQLFTFPFIQTESGFICRRFFVLIPLLPGNS
jgi:hypothetical protein